ncbi:MAG: hypothetical protein CBD04_003095 [bacterium TMED144]|nr:MAG: hypothetical protein CBD04_003095 [bacterium TMED144]
MKNYLKFSTNDILKLSDGDFTAYFKLIQKDLQKKLDSGKNIDELLDEEDPFEALEPILPEEIYPIVVLAMINNIQTENVMLAILEGFHKAKKKQFK